MQSTRLPALSAGESTFSLDINAFGPLRKNCDNLLYDNELSAL